MRRVSRNFANILPDIQQKDAAPRMRRVSRNLAWLLIYFVSARAAPRMRRVSRNHLEPDEIHVLKQPRLA